MVDISQEQTDSNVGIYLESKPILIGPDKELRLDKTILGGIFNIATWGILISGLTWYRRGIDLITGQYVLDYSSDGGVTWETLISINPDESTIIQDPGNLYRHRIVGTSYHIDQELTATGYAGIEGTDWENLYHT